MSELACVTAVQGTMQHTSPFQRNEHKRTISSAPFMQCCISSERRAKGRDDEIWLSLGMEECRNIYAYLISR
jgi:hypothetical protein